MSDDYPVYGPQVKRPLRVRVLQAASLVLALAGLVLLWLYSVHRDIPLVQVADIRPTMNFAYVRIAGEVSRDAYVFDSGGLVFNLDDGSGEIAVMGGRAQAEVLENAGRLPRRGDRVEVAGSLSVSADQEVKLRMQSADQLTLRRKRSASAVPAAQVPLRLSDVTSAKKGETLSVTGTLKEVHLPGPGSKAPFVLTLEQDGTELDVIFWDKVFQGLEKKLPMPGKTISARGRVDVYKDKVQLKVWEASDLQEVSPPAAGEAAGLDGALTPIAQITAAQKGTVFTVCGVLGEPKSIRGGVLYPIADQTGEMVVLFWDKQVSGEERDLLEAGVRLRVRAPLVVYKGTLELVPEDAGSFRVETGE